MLGASVAALFAASIPALAQTGYSQGPLLDIVRTMEEGSWQRVNVNKYSEVWTPSALRPLYVGTVQPPSKIIAAWSSFAWDSNRGDLIIYGGGHANYSGNDVYRWRSRSLRWERAALPSETLKVGSNTWVAIDGADAAPTSAHTYDNAVFMPLLDRYMNFGGAIYNTGSGYVQPDEINPSVLRYTGPYLFDPERADPNKVGGTTGSHVQRNGPYPEILGGEMWQNRDMHKHLAGTLLPRSFVNGCTAYSDESDVNDVVYMAARTNPLATSIDLYRYEIVDVNMPWLDQVSRVGRYSSSPSAQTTCGYDPETNIVLRTGTNTSPFYFWNLDNAGSTNYEQRVAVTGSVKAFVDELNRINRTLPYCAMDYDPVRGDFLVWCGSGQVWRIVPPMPMATTGWEVIPEALPQGEVPPNAVGVGILGKWKYVPGFDVFIGLQGNEDGDIWVYKPAAWVDPGDGGGPVDPPPPNVLPQVSITAPSAGAVLTLGLPAEVRANATDADGQVVEVRFRVDGALIGSDSTPPYSVQWTPTTAGIRTLSADVVDDRGAIVTSQAVTVMAQAPANIPPEVALTAPAAGAVLTQGVAVELRADASDADGNVVEVRFTANGAPVGSANASPFTVTWTPTSVGEVTLSAEAIDDRGASTVAAARTVSVQQKPPSAGDGGTAVIQRGNADSVVADSYLSSFHPNNNFGTSEWMDVVQSGSYAPLVRFAVFASEGGPVPDGAVITAAKLHLYKSSYDGVLAVHAMLQPWVEREANWNRPRIGASWNRAGAKGEGSDYEALEDARVSAPWSAGWVVFDVSERLQRIATGTAENHGWRVLRLTHSSNRIQLRSSDSVAAPALRPKLEVEWSLPSP